MSSSDTQFLPSNFEKIADELADIAVRNRMARQARELAGEVVKIADSTDLVNIISDKLQKLPGAASQAWDTAKSKATAFAGSPGVQTAVDWAKAHPEVAGGLAGAAGGAAIGGLSTLGRKPRDRHFLSNALTGGLTGGAMGLGGTLAVRYGKQLLDKGVTGDPSVVEKAQKIETAKQLGQVPLSTRILSLPGQGIDYVRKNHPLLGGIAGLDAAGTTAGTTAAVLRNKANVPSTSLHDFTKNLETTDSPLKDLFKNTVTDPKHRLAALLQARSGKNINLTTAPNYKSVVEGIVGGGGGKPGSGGGSGFAEKLQQYLEAGGDHEQGLDHFLRTKSVQSAGAPDFKSVLNRLIGSDGKQKGPATAAFAGPSMGAVQRKLLHHLESKGYAPAQFSRFFSGLGVQGYPDLEDALHEGLAAEHAKLNVTPAAQSHPDLLATIKKRLADEAKTRSIGPTQIGAINKSPLGNFELPSDVAGATAKRDPSFFGYKLRPDAASPIGYAAEKTPGIGNLLKKLVKEGPRQGYQSFRGEGGQLAGGLRRLLRNGNPLGSSRMAKIGPRLGLYAGLPLAAESYRAYKDYAAKQLEQQRQIDEITKGQ